MLPSLIACHSSLEQRAAIDMALAHTPKGESESEAAYNRAQLLDQRRVLFDRWGDLLFG